MSHQENLEELTTHCIRCGFCLESCPTFKVTGNETESPRGRIYLVRSALEGKLDWGRDVGPHIDQCLGCRACETACPSGVQYGHIAELARERLAKADPKPVRGLLLKGLTDPKLARIQMALGRMLPGRKLPAFLSEWIAGAPAEAQTPPAPSNDPWPPLDERDLPPVRGEVFLLRGCVMRVLFDPVHEATVRLLRRVGYRVLAADAGCCGALHAHNGMLDDARSLARRLVEDVPPEVPVIVNSAGCGSTLKEYGTLDEALAPFAGRVHEATVFLLREGLGQALAAAPGLDETVTYHDACHLAHGQKITHAPRGLIQAVPHLRYVPLEEADTCCGSAGIYNVLQPKMARALLDRKWSYVQQTGARIVATGNPGCHAWIEQASREQGGTVRVVHTLELLEAAFSGWR